MATCYGRRLARSVGLLLALLFLEVFAARGQAVAPAFDMDAVCVRPNGSTSGTRLDVYLRIPYAQLRFINDADGFSARFEVTLDVYEADERGRARSLAENHIWTERVLVQSFGETQTDRLHARTLQSIELPPGHYLLRAQVEDMATRQSYERELAVEVRDLSRTIALSDLVLIDGYDRQSNSIAPAVSNRIGTDAPGFKIFYEVYADRPRTVRVTSEVIRAQKSGGAAAVKALFGLGDDDRAEVSYQHEEPEQLKKGRNQFVVDVPLDTKRAGEYVVRVRVENESGRVLDAASRAIVAEWTGLADHVRDLDEAILQLSYIAKKKDIDHIRDGRTLDERRRRFLDFWKRRDPTPDTDRNERMEEYYYRVAFANRQYGSGIAGWRTDRGQVMVLFGEPDYVERHTDGGSAKPYEVWYYYGIARRFIFVDRNGGGDYRLLVPIWDERTRIR